MLRPAAPKPRAIQIGLDLGDAETVAIVLMPDAELVIREVDLTEYYAGEIVVQQVPVNRQ